MPKYRVLRPIEHNGKLYLPPRPAGSPPESGGDSGVVAIGGGHGKEVPVDAGGVIELTEAEAAPMTEGQIEKIRNQKLESKKEKEQKKAE